MNKTMRSVTMAGLGLLAGATMAAGPAMASGSDAAATAKPEKTAAQQHRQYGTAVVGYYGSRSGCQQAAVFGGKRGFWAASAYSCDTVRVIPAGVIGVRPGAYALIVDPDACNWGAAGFQSYYTTSAFRFAGDGFLAYGPQWRAWVASPVGVSPFGYRGGRFVDWYRFGNRGHGWGKHWGNWGGQYGGGHHGGGSYGGGKPGGSYGGGNPGGSYGGGNKPGGGKHDGDYRGGKPGGGKNNNGYGGNANAGYGGGSKSR